MTSEHTAHRHLLSLFVSWRFVFQRSTATMPPIMPPTIFPVPTTIAGQAAANRWPTDWILKTQQVAIGVDPVQTSRTMMTGYFWIPDSDRSPAGTDDRWRMTSYRSWTMDLAAPRPPRPTTWPAGIWLAPALLACILPS